MKSLLDTKYIFVLFFLSVTISFGQKESTALFDDTLKTSEKSEYKIKLNNNPLLRSPLFIIKRPMIFDEFSMFVLPNIEQVTNEENISMMQLRNEINQTMNIYRKGQNKYHLGVVGDILGYVSTAAAAGLAVYHVTKYKKHYGVK